MTSDLLDYQSAAWRDAYPISRIGCRERPLVLLGPHSYLGSIYSPLIVGACRNVCAVVDDQAKDEAIFGVPRWSSSEFRSRAGGISGLIAVDLSYSPMGNAIFGRLISEASIDRADLVQVLAELDLPTVYQTPTVMRDRTIARQSEWHALRKAFEDPQSVRTLDAILLLRLTFDRRYLRRVTTSPEDEYFSVYDSRTTFTLRDDEVICDAGAYIGSTVRKMVSTGATIRAIHAFEPDRGSFGQLQNLMSLRLPGLKLHNAAVGDYTGTVRFLETGTMGSHVEETLDVAETSDRAISGGTPIIRLDDAMDEVTFIKMDLEGFETRALNGAANLIDICRPRMAITGYHYADDLLDIAHTIGHLAPDYALRLRHHSNYYYDSILYAAPREDRDAARYLT